MNENTLYQGMSEEGLKSLLDELTKQVGRAETYNVLSESQEGKLLIADMRKRLDFNRKQYQFIDATRPEAPYLLATIQAYEREIQEWLNKLVGFKDYPKDVQAKIDAIRKMIQQNKIKARSDNQIAPSALMKD